MSVFKKIYPIIHIVIRKGNYIKPFSETIIFFKKEEVNFMRVTEVAVHPVANTKTSFVGFADVTFDGVFIVKGIRVKKRQNGTYVAIMPVRKPTKADEAKKRKVNIFHPLTNEFRVEIEKAIQDAFKAQESEQPETPLAE